MKKIHNYINEKLVIHKKMNVKIMQYNYYPKTKEELQDIIKERIGNEGNKCDLNDIDVSDITDMSYLFDNMHYFNCNISKWDVSNVTNMSNMFNGCTLFNCDISNWNTINVEDMSTMFYKCSKFNQDISSWNVRNVTDMFYMFCDCVNFNQDLSSWDVRNVKDASYMFFHCFALDGSKLEKWNLSYNTTNMHKMFIGCESTPLWWQHRWK